MAELTEQALNEAADAMEAVSGEILDAADATRGLSPREFRLVLVGIGTGLIFGAAGGAFFMERRLRTKYERMAEEEIDAMRDHFRARLVAKEVKPELSDLGKKVEDLGYRPPAETPGPAVIEAEVADPTAVEPEDFETRNVFDGHPDDIPWDAELELQNRSRNEGPYVIHVDERHERNYTESTLTYYAGDDVLCDEKDRIIEDQEQVVGVENLDRFGHGSNDANIVYIRNDDLAIEVEVIKSERTYAEDVHGMTHGVQPRPRRPRWDE